MANSDWKQQYEEAYRSLHNQPCKIVDAGSRWYRIDDGHPCRNRWRRREIEKMTLSLKLRIERARSKGTVSRGRRIGTAVERKV